MENLPVFPPPPTYSRSTSPNTSRWLSPSGRRPKLRSAPGSDDIPVHIGQSAEQPKIKRQNSFRFFPRSQFWKLIDEWWLWELLSWLVAALCMGAIAIILSVYNGRTQPKWPMGLTINAAVSILGAIVKAALLLPMAEALGQLKWNWFARRSRNLQDFQTFDEASRGPWGSFVLILRTRGRALAALGAGVVVLSTILDPFFQQVVTFPSRVVAVGNATIPRRVTYWNDASPGFTVQGVESFTYDNSFAYYIQPILRNTTSINKPPVTATCSTGNCTFPKFETLGTCSSCTDVSALLKFRCLESQRDWTSDVYNSSQGNYKKITACGWYLNATNDRPVLMTGYSLHNTSDVLIGRTLALLIPDAFANQYAMQTLYNGSIHYKKIQNALMDSIIVSTPGGYDAVKANATPVAYECNLHTCVKEISSLVRAGKVEEAVHNTYINETAPAFNPLVVTASDQYSGLDWTYIGPQVVRSPRTQEVFSIAQNDTATRFIYGMSDFMRSYTTATSNTSAPSFRWGNYAWPQPPAITRTLFNPWVAPTNISLHMDQVAALMTDTFRLPLNETGLESVVGIAWGEQTYVHLRWQWFAMPLSLLLIGLIFLIAAIVQSHQGKMDIYKTSALAMLYHGLREDLASEHRSRSKANTTNLYQERGSEAEERLLVQLRGRKGTWRFSRNIPY